MMENVVGKALAGFEAALGQFRAEIASDAELSDFVFRDTAGWVDLLTYKLVPHLSGGGCLVAALAGGTNTGKSTVFNVLLGRDVSAVMSTAAATCHPVLAANARRMEECLASKLVPEFEPMPLEQAADATRHDVSDTALFVALCDSLPDTLVILDTPDIDSIDMDNWEVTEHIRAAGDVLIAVLTGEKYKDERVVAFFRRALESGRRVIPLMNKANPERDFEVAKKQLAEFCEDVGTSGPSFVIPHDFELSRRCTGPIVSLEDGVELRAYLESLDVPALKKRVFKDTVKHFAEESGGFITRTLETHHLLQDVAASFELKAAAYSAKYDPTPGEAVGGLFHEFVQSKRGGIRRAIGTASASVVRGVSAVGRRLKGAVMQRTTLQTNERVGPEQLRARHVLAVERLVQELVTECVEATRHVKEPAGHLLAGRFQGLDTNTAIQEISKATALSENVSEEFRAHAMEMLDTWWEDHKGKRRVLEALDTTLAIMPAAIAVPISVYTGGVGVPEAVVFAGPIAAQFVTRVMEYQFGDAMFDFLSPWKREQQEALRQAMIEQIVRPCLEDLYRLKTVFESSTIQNMKECQEQCLTASSTS